MNRTGHRANNENYILLFLTKLHKSHQPLQNAKVLSQSSMRLPTCNTITQEAEAGGLQDQGHPKLHNKFQGT